MATWRCCIDSSERMQRSWSGSRSWNSWTIPCTNSSAKGNIDFALEMMYLKPSLATKLNKDGLSPLHVALKNQHAVLALSLLKIDKSLASVKGRMGYTPIHYLAMCETNKTNLLGFLNGYPDCIDDLTSRDETALHIALKNDNSSAVHVLLQWLRRTSKCSMWQKKRILEAKNRDQETLLHIAVSKELPDPKIVRLLADLGVETKEKNSAGKTAVEVLKDRAEGGDINKCLEILHRRKFWNLLQVVPRILGQMVYEIRQMSADRGNALLVVTVLILTATYQATLSPPGGFYQANSPGGDSNNKFSRSQIYVGSMNCTTASDFHHHHHKVENVQNKANNGTVGSSVLRTAPFLWFFIPNLMAFYTSFLLTCSILCILVSGFFTFVLISSLSMLQFCLLYSALTILSPNDETRKILLCCVYPMVLVSYLAITPLASTRLRTFLKKVRNIIYSRLGLYD